MDWTIVLTVVITGMFGLITTLISYSKGKKLKQTVVETQRLDEERTWRREHEECHHRDDATLRLLLKKSLSQINRYANEGTMTQFERKLANDIHDDYELRNGNGYGQEMIDEINELYSRQKNYM